LEIGTKIQILQDESKNAEIAFLSHLVFPTGTEELTGGSFGIINKFCMSYPLTDDIGLGYNVGLNYLGEGSELTKFEDFVLNFDAGFTYLANDNLQFDFSFGTGVSHKMNYISVGCSWLMEKE